MEPQYMDQHIGMGGGGGGYAPYHAQQQQYQQSQDREEDVAGKIFIGGLSWQTSEQTLREHFERYGELSDVALMYDKRTNKPRGFGFVTMRDAQAVDAVMSEEHTIDGRLVDVKRALPRDKAPGPINVRSESLKIFVGGLSPEVTEMDFTDYFSKFGSVRDAVVMMDRSTGSSRGFGFVTFASEGALNEVLQSSHELLGKPVEVKRAEPKDTRMGGAPGGGGFDYRSRDMGRRDGGYSQGAGRYERGADYGGYPQGGGYMGARGGGGYGNRYAPAAGGYGGGGAYRGYGVPMAGYSYAPAPQGMSYYPGAPAGVPPGGYPGYGAASAAAGGYGGRPDPYGGGAGGPGPDYSRGGPQGGESKGPQDSGAIAASYASAAMQMRSQQPSYSYGNGGAPVPGYGAGGYGNGGEPSQGYGAYRGQGVADNRAGRSYRPY